VHVCEAIEPATIPAVLERWLTDHSVPEAREETIS
jgi:hypothetical protein